MRYLTNIFSLFVQIDIWLPVNERPLVVVVPDDVLRYVYSIATASLQTGDVSLNKMHVSYFTIRGCAPG